LLPEGSAIEPVVCTRGGMKAGSALVDFYYRRVGPVEIVRRRWVWHHAQVEGHPFPDAGGGGLDLGMVLNYLVGLAEYADFGL